MSRAQSLRVLGLSADATEPEIRSAYKKLALAWHPDRNKAPDATQKFQEISRAYQILTNPDADPEEFTFDNLPEDIILAMFGSMFGLDPVYGFDDMDHGHSHTCPHHHNHVHDQNQYYFSSQGFDDEQYSDDESYFDDDSVRGDESESDFDELPVMMPAPKLVSAHGDALELAWTACDQSTFTAIRYKLLMRANHPSVTTFYLVYEGPETKYVVPNLLPKITYMFKICACNSHGQGLYSEIVQYDTVGEYKAVKEHPPIYSNLVIAQMKRAKKNRKKRAKRNAKKKEEALRRKVEENKADAEEVAKQRRQQAVKEMQKAAEERRKEQEARDAARKAKEAEKKKREEEREQERKRKAERKRQRKAEQARKRAEAAEKRRVEEETAARKAEEKRVAEMIAYEKMLEERRREIEEEAKEAERRELEKFAKLKAERERSEHAQDTKKDSVPVKEKTSPQASCRAQPQRNAALSHNAKPGSPTKVQPTTQHQQSSQKPIYKPNHSHNSEPSRSLNHSPHASHNHTAVHPHHNPTHLPHPAQPVHQPAGNHSHSNHQRHQPSPHSVSHNTAHAPPFVHNPPSNHSSPSRARAHHSPQQHHSAQNHPFTNHNRISSRDSFPHTHPNTFANTQPGPSIHGEGSGNVFRSAPGTIPDIGRPFDLPSPSHSNQSGFSTQAPSPFLSFPGTGAFGGPTSLQPQPQPQPPQRPGPQDESQEIIFQQFPGPSLVHQPLPSVLPFSAGPRPAFAQFTPPAQPVSSLHGAVVDPPYDPNANFDPTPHPTQHHSAPKPPTANKQEQPFFDPFRSGIGLNLQL